MLECNILDSTQTARIDAGSNKVAVSCPGQMLRYRVSVTALALLLALSPVWFFWSLFAAISMISEACCVFMQSGHGEVYLLPIFFYFALVTAGCMAVMVCADNKLHFDQNSIRLPWQFLLDLKFCRERPWSSLRSIDFEERESSLSQALLRENNQTAGQSKQPEKMVLSFDDGTAVSLAIKGFSCADLKNLILAVQSFAPQAVFKQALSAVKLNFDGSVAAKGLHPSFTQLWEEELDSQFGSTIFVPLEPGQVLERQSGALKVEAQMSFGGLSAVYLVSQEQRGAMTNTAAAEFFVLKEAVLPASADNNLKQKALEMFERESRLLSALNHPRIARVIDFFVANQRNYILLEHIEGLDLRRFVSRHGAQDPAVARRWLLEGAAILQYLHSQNPPVVHRDVTPDNLVLARDGHLSLIDFGAANTLVGTATGTLVGKQSYIAPEQFRGKASAASDIYSLGATIYFALTACDPEPLTRLYPAQVIANINPGLNQLIADCTEQETASRLTSLTDLVSRAQALELS